MSYADAISLIHTSKFGAHLMSHEEVTSLTNHISKCEGGY